MTRFGIIGLGNMGASHANRLINGEIPNAALAAVCDRNSDRCNAFPDVASFSDHNKMFQSGLIDAVIVATHHFVHTPISIDAIEHGINFLVEKPLGVHKSDCEKTIQAYDARKKDDLVFAVMFNQRTRPVYRKLKALIDNGELGAIRRINWTITDWFRSESYYRSGGWRATWKGEGGGVLLNQCPHQLDLLQWLFGMPVRVRAFGSLGKYHDIEVEDEITAYLEFPEGCTGIFIASTGEAPGINRLEIAAERGRVVLESDRIEWIRNEVETRVFSAETPTMFAKPDTWKIEIPVETQEIQEHSIVVRQFVQAIEGEGDLVAHGTEGLKSVELGNAMLYSLLTDQTIELPLDGEAYRQMLDKLIAGSRFKEAGTKASVTTTEDMNKTF